jgi:methylmalonyl-CoA mutase
MNVNADIYKPVNPVRVVTATSLFDGHDAAINIMRRILQSNGVEVVHLGHNRSVKEIVDAAVEEDTQGIAVSSYQGGHVEYFKYMVNLLKESGAGHIKIFGGGGGVIIPDEIDLLERYGVEKIYSPEDGARLGLQGIINDLVKRIDFPLVEDVGLDPDWSQLDRGNRRAVAHCITFAEYTQNAPAERAAGFRSQLAGLAAKRPVPVVGITGTGGAGKSSLTDELIQRILNDLPDIHVAVISCDPSRRKTGGALLGDRIRMNAIGSDRVFMRSLATRRSQTEIPAVLPLAVDVTRAAGFDLVIAETAGIGQGDSQIIDLVDVSIYVMTADFGAASQLEKIDMLDFADLVVVNKYEKRGGEDAVRDVRKQVQRNRSAFDRAPEEMPVYGTIASKFNDDGVTALYHGLLDTVAEKTGTTFTSSLPRPAGSVSTSKTIIIPPERVRYLSEISDTLRTYHHHTAEQADAIRRRWHLEESAKTLAARAPGAATQALVDHLKEQVDQSPLDEKTRRALDEWQEIRATYEQDELVYNVRDKEIRVPLFTESLSHQKIPKIALPAYTDPGEIYQWLRKENIPGRFPYTAGVFPLKRVGEDPTRMFAGEGDPNRTNRRFKLLSADYTAKRLSTAFDSVTLYGYDPDERPDIYGKVGTSGVSICSLDDMKSLYSGFDLCAPNTSVSMTINGPAPIILAMFLNTAIDQQVAQFESENGQAPDSGQYEEIRARALATVRGTVQADILKEDQGQNTCIFSIDFALKMMGDIQSYFIDRHVRNFYSVSISGYHIAEAGANPITQLALTLSNGFTYVEYYLSRGMPIDSFAPNLSFFFSNGLDPEYTVIGRVARRIWSIAMREKYGAAPRSQKLKYHIQTSGRSLHSQDINFNDIRTTLQALCAIYDNCNSLHTNAFDEAITTPSNESVRRALAIQLIINREWGLAKNENPYQGSFIVDELTDLVEEAVLMEFDRITSRGGVLGAMETGYQRGKIQEESMYYEYLKHSGQYPIIGVNTFRDPDRDLDELSDELELARATEEEKESQLRRLAAFHQRNAGDCETALSRLKQVVLAGDNIFEELMRTTRVCSLGQITRALYDVGGQYRRNM